MPKRDRCKPSFSQGNQQITSKRRKNLLAKDITVVLTIKFILIYGLWYTFFSQPLDDQLTDHSVSSVMFGSSNQPSTQVEVK